MRRLSRENAADHTGKSWPSGSHTTFPLLESHTLNVRSHDVLITKVPSGEYRTVQTALLCASNPLCIGLNVFASQTVMVLSSDPVTNVSPDGWYAIDRILSECATSGLVSIAPVAASQTMTDLSNEPEAMCRPFGEYETADTVLECPINGPKTLSPVDESQTNKELLYPPETMRVLSGDMATENTLSRASFTKIHSPVCGFHFRKVLSVEPDIRKSPSFDHVILLTLEICPESR